VTTATQAKARTPDLDSGRRRRAALIFISRYGTIIGLLAMIVFFAINAPGTFLSRANLLNILSQASLTAIISAGLTFTLVVGEFDLSIGNVASFIGLVVAGLMAKEHLPIPAAVALALLVGVFIGLVNGFLVTKVRINAVIATIGVGTMLTGLGFSYSAFPIAIGIPRAFTQISIGRALFGVPNPVFVKAVGSNIEAARLSGIRVDRTKMFAFATAGFCAALTGVLLTSLLGSGTLAAADGYLLDAFAAVFLGSATLREGQFHIAGTLIGVLILAVGFNGLSIFGAPTYFQPIFKGGVLVLAVGLSSLARRYASAS
jgi:ribose transport system permease protein